ncbi:MAG: VWD domain-containing protein [Acidimicrobiales bacterium]
MVIAGAVVLCALFCGPALAGAAAFFGGLAVAEAGTVTVGAAVAGLGALLAGLLAWNLWGDPHLVTLDRFTYDLQSVGEFHLLEAPQAGVDVQARFRAAGPNLSVLDQVATEINDQRVEIGDGFVKVDGVVVDLPMGGAHPLGAGAVVTRGSQGYTVLWPGVGDQQLAMVANGNRVGFVVPPSSLIGPIRGLLGNHDGDTTNDLALRDGTQLPSNAGSATLHGSFADSWRITDDESLFTYAANQSTATFTDLSAPQNVVTLGDFSEAEVVAATQACAAAGVEPGPQFDACALDLAATGDSRFAEEAALVDDVIVSRDADAFDATGRVIVDYQGAVPPNFRAVRYSIDPATTRIAGPLFDREGYRFYVRDIGRHDGVSLAADIYAFGPVSSDSHPQSVALTVNKQERGSILFDGGEPRFGGGLTGSITSTGVGVTGGGQSFTRYRVQIPFGRVGESLDVELTPSNFSGVQGTALGVDNVDLALDIPPAQRFAASEPLSVPGAPGSGIAAQDGAGVLETAGAADVYDFEVSAADAGHAHVISASNCTTALTYTLTNTTTGNRVGRWPQGCARLTTPSLPAGRYSLTVETVASGAAGSYSLQLFVQPDPQRFQYTVGTTVRDGAPLPGAGNLETVASVDVFAFFTAGGGHYLDQRACAPGEQWVLRATGSATPLAGGGCADRPLEGLSPGEYEIAVSTSSNTTAGTYAFQLFATPVAPQDFAVSLPLTVGDQWPAAGAGNLETKQSVDRYDFNVDSPAPMYIDTQTCPPGGTLGWKLLNASSTVVDTGDCADKQTAILPAGAYRLDISSANEGVGAYEFQAWLVPMTPQSFTLTLPAQVSTDQPATGAGNLETKASQDIYDFIVPDGKPTLYVDQMTCSKPNMLTWRLVRDVNGIAVTVANGTCDPRQIRQLAQGSYRLVVTPVGESHGTYSLRVVPSDAASPAIVHVPQTTAFYGRPIPIDATTTCKSPATSCFAKLHYRTSSAPPMAGVVALQATAWTEQRMTLVTSTTTGDTTLLSWTGTIPGSAVTTTGVDYFVTAGDGDNRNELPTAPPAPGGLGGTPTGLGLGVAEVPYLHVSTISPPLLTHLPPGYGQVDKDIRLELRASCSTGQCSARLHHRASAGLAPGAAELVGDPGWPTITMAQTDATPLGDTGQLLTYTATIPGRDVDTRGVDYYFDVTDTHTTAYWPGTTYQGYYAPRDGMRTAFQTIHVLEPPHIVHAPVPTTPYRTSTAITATSNCPATRSCTARLYYRTTNSADVFTSSLLTDEGFTQVPMSVTKLSLLPGNDLITVSAAIPASYADTRGIDYFFRIDDGSTTSWFPGTGQVQGYVTIDGTRVAYQHVRVLEQPHITPSPVLATKALQPYTITARMTCVTQDCSLTLHWRNDLAAGEPDPGWHTERMTPIGVPTSTPAGPQYTYTHTIPAAKVTTRGLAYYLEGYDGHVHDFAPGTSYWGAYLPLDGQPLDIPVGVNGGTLPVGSFIVRVLEPPHLVHAPPGVVQKGTPLTLSATSNCSSSSCPATLSWTDKDGQAQAVTMTAVRQTDNGGINPPLPGDLWQYTGTIPGADTTTTVHYTISVTDGYTGDTTPPLQALVYEPATG